MRALEEPLEQRCYSNFSLHCHFRRYPHSLLSGKRFPTPTPYFYRRKTLPFSSLPGRSPRSRLIHRLTYINFPLCWYTPPHPSFFLLQSSLKTPILLASSVLSLWGPFTYWTLYIFVFKKEITSVLKKIQTAVIITVVVLTLKSVFR